MIDIVLCTRDRIGLFKATARHIVTRTQSPYQLHVIDDGSTEHNGAVADRWHRDGAVASVLHRQRPAGIAANLRALTLITISDPLVFTDDDVLCPDMAPDWLARLLGAMDRRPRLGVLALNNPQCNLTNARHPLREDGEVTLCERVGGTFAMIRRAVLDAVRVPNGVQSPMRYLCLEAGKRGFEVGYLTETYCQHIGGRSVRWEGKDYGPLLTQVRPVDSATLVPPEAYR